MKTQTLLRAGTLVFFFCMIGGFVAYKSGLIQLSENNIPQAQQPDYINTLASNTKGVIDTPPGLQTTLPEIPDSVFRIMMSSKTMIILDQSSLFPDNGNQFPEHFYDDSIFELPRIKLDSLK